ncbi:MAG: hypothetical protein ABNH16_02190 [Thalassolituus sp.]|jgi:hypothetical protein
MALVKTANGLELGTPGIGKTLVFAPKYEAAGRILDKAAEDGHYYPLMAMKHLRALSTGLSGKDNVFIPNINDFKTNSFQKVMVFVPGIVAMVERRSDDKLVISRLDLSDDYEGVARKLNNKPGVYSVKKVGNTLDVEHREGDVIADEKHRCVVVASPSYENQGDAAKEAQKSLKSLFGQQVAAWCDFDLFYSPVGAQHKGMRNYNPTLNTQTYAFAGLLADAMERSKHQEGVAWASEQYGSIVLTQALMTLAAKNISFKDKGHSVTMRWSKSDPQFAHNAAMKLGINSDKRLLSSGTRASFSAAQTNYARVMDKSDDFSLKDYGEELVNGTMTATALVSTGLLIGGAGAVMSAPTAVGMAGLLTGSVGAIKFIYDKANQTWGRG